MKSSSGPSPKILDRFLRTIESTPPSDKLLLRILFFAMILTGIWFVFSINQHYSEITPTRGGSITEGIVGIPRFVNPALAITRADQDMTALIYSGLMKIDPNGNLIKDVADTIDVSEDGLTYNITIRKDVRFHDQTPLTARDVVYTIQLIQNPDLKSPLRGNWSDVTVEELGEYELSVKLKEPYAPFIENFTVGIMPAHAWSSLPIEQLPFSQLNTEPIGSGPFAIAGTRRDTSGLIKNYTLTAFRDNSDDPKIDTLEMIFFSNETTLLDALQEKTIEATAYLSTEYIGQLSTTDYQIIEKPLPRMFGIFFNQNKSPALRDKSVREALTLALDRDTLINNSLDGFGVPLYGPTTFSQPTLDFNDNIVDTASTTFAEQAVHVLETGGWSQNSLNLWEKEIDKSPVTLSVTIRTSNTPLFDSLIRSVAKQWEDIGVAVTIEQFEQTGLVQSVIRPRDFEALLFGLDTSRSHDLYPFWHSSQQTDPGLNIAQYANTQVDRLLESSRTEQAEADRLASLQEAGNIIIDEHPAIFLFQPTLAYVISNKITVTDMGNIGRPSDRFSNITDWHTENDSLWPIFRKNNI